MSKKDFRILIAISDQKFAQKVLKDLKKSYTISLSKDLKQFSKSVHEREFDLIVIDYRFCGMKAEDLYHSITLFHPHAVFIVYTQKDKKELAIKTWKRRAFDYITHTRDAYGFVEEIHKCVRWTIQKGQVSQLQKQMSDLAETIKELGRKIEKEM